MSTQAELEFKYSFLKDVRKEKDAILMGINPTNKYQHELLKSIKTLNTIQHATKGMLFNINNTILEQLQIDMKTAVTNLASLVNNQLAAQVCCFEFDAHNRELKVGSFFITHPSEDKSYSIYNLFDELLSYSYNAIKSYFDTREQLLGENFRKELLWQMSSKNADPNSFKGISSLFNPYRRFMESKNGIPISDDMIEYINRELTKRLVESQIAKEVPGHGLLMLKTNEILDHFEAAANAMIEKFIPANANDPTLKSRIDRIVLEEKVYNQVENFPIKTARFAADKAKEIHQYKTIAPGKANSIYPGSLCIQSIISLESAAEERYAIAWRDECNKMKQEFKKNITVPSNKWSKLILFVNHSDSLEIHPEVWKDLINDKDLFYIKWQMPKNTIHVFTGKDPNFFKVLVTGMLNLPANDMWKASALKALIEKYEKQLRSLMTDQSFFQVYQNLEKRIYMQYMPWYYRIFLYFPFSLFQDVILVNAKKKISVEQEVFSSKNDAHNLKYISEMQSKKMEKSIKIKEQALFESVIETLDLFYLTMKKIPTVNDVKNYFPDMEAFSNIINTRSFRILNLPLKGSEETEVLLYPDNNDWQDNKKALIVKALDSIINDRNPHLVVANADKAKIEKAQKLLNAIEGNSAPKLKAAS
ncbi:MAG TPA: hypothetical protein PK079_15775 [Leptospiraceae bacterium]|nr:hypothetical protein [Leptospiraceae bacterium]HMW07356.1 hypothetical protein [Leptospiraceae bacterium]HMX34390.1 hypothetical protein [Leptospiraceae bacterium]HMY32936.1 hypothetical protein [Leptospiraceae bacterium]HMZ64550.1 hypothetical protein [Leptospiraceae bacterium]